MNLTAYHAAYETELARMIKLGHSEAFARLAAMSAARKFLIVTTKERA